MLKLRCTLPNLANLCLYKSTTAKFYPFTENDKDLLEKLREDMVGGPSKVYTRKSVMDEIVIRSSANWCKSIVGIDASQLHLFSMWQAMPTGLHMSWELESPNEYKWSRTKRVLNFMSCKPFLEAGKSLFWFQMILRENSNQKPI